MKSVSEGGITVYVQSNGRSMRVIELPPNQAESESSLNTLKSGERKLPEDQMIMLFAATKAASELGCQCKVVDVGQWSYLKSLKGPKVPIPSVSVGHRILKGRPKTSEIVDTYKQAASR
ncbi:MAG: hypothetical protein GF309_00455 [Candidatus Lokiarchaeota archaeon]|nr:hypothetical protein [Candidatus Lokiarchaeota archaeon]